MSLCVARKTKKKNGGRMRIEVLPPAYDDNLSFDE